MYASLDMSAARTQRTANDKWDTYLRVGRGSRRVVSAPRYRASSDVFHAASPIMEFKLGEVDNRDVYVTFQIADDAAVLQDAPLATTRDSPGRYVIARRLFLERYVREAAYRMPSCCSTALSGAPYQ